MKTIIQLGDGEYGIGASACPQGMMLTIDTLKEPGKVGATVSKHDTEETVLEIRFKTVADVDVVMEYLKAIRGLINIESTYRLISS